MVFLYFIMRKTDFKDAKPPLMPKHIKQEEKSMGRRLSVSL